VGAELGAVEEPAEGGGVVAAATGEDSAEFFAVVGWHK